MEIENTIKWIIINWLNIIIIKLNWWIKYINKNIKWIRFVIKTWYLNINIGKIITKWSN